jgi:hypothetical protein
MNKTLLTLTCLLAFAAQALSADLPKLESVALFSSTVTNATYTTTGIVPIPAQHGKVLVAQMATSGASATNVQTAIIKLKASLDGVNWVAITDYGSITNTLSGTGVVDTITAVCTNVLARYIGVSTVQSASVEPVTFHRLKLTWLDNQ